MNKKVLIPTIVIIVLILIGGATWYYEFNSQKNITDESTELLNIDPSEFLIFEIKKENLSEYQKEAAFNRFNEAKNLIEQNKVEGLNYKDTANFYAWLAITGSQKVIGDYISAENIWLWFTEAYPGNSVSPANLADLYKSFLVDKDKSEKYYKIALEREKHDFQIYHGLYELYRYVFEDEDKAIVVLEDGLENNPDSKNYVTELINYLISLDKKKQAEEVIDQWLINHPEDFSLKAKLN